MTTAHGSRTSERPTTTTPPRSLPKCSCGLTTAGGRRVISLSPLTLRLWPAAFTLAKSHITHALTHGTAPTHKP